MPEEKIYIIGLRRLYWTVRSGRASRAVKKIRDYLYRHTKAEKIVIDESINEYVFSRSYDKPPRKVAVRIIQLDDEGKVLKATLALPVEEKEKPEEGEGSH